MHVKPTYIPKLYLSVYPVLDVNVMLGESPGLQQLVYAMNGQEAGHVRIQVVRDWHFYGMRSDHLFGENFLSEHLLHPGHVVVSDWYFHA